MKFVTKLIASLEARGPLCVGLDSRYDRLPDFITASVGVTEAVVAFNKEVIASTHDLVGAYKMNVSFYAAFGLEGLAALEQTNEYLRTHYPHIPLLADCKRSEMGTSVEMVRKEIFEWLGFDCVMVTPWFGFDTVREYLSDEARGVCVYVHDSNPTATELQDAELKDGRKLYELVSERVARVWNTNGNVFVEAGATYPTQLKRVRTIVGEDMVILTAGIGTQGGKSANLRGVFGKGGKRLLVNSSRDIIFSGSEKADYFPAVRAAAVNLRTELEAAAGA